MDVTFFLKSRTLYDRIAGIGFNAQRLETKNKTWMFPFVCWIPRLNCQGNISACALSEAGCWSLLRKIERFFYLFSIVFNEGIYLPWIYRGWQVYECIWCTVRAITGENICITTNANATKTLPPYDPPSIPGVGELKKESARRLR